MQKEQREFERLHHELKHYLKRIPGYGQMILVILTMPMKERIESLTTILEWFKRYPGMKITGMRTRDDRSLDRHVLRTAYKCEDCEKKCETETSLGGSARGETHSFDIHSKPSKQDGYLVCEDCMRMYNEDQDYDPVETAEPDPNRVAELMKEGMSESNAEVVSLEEEENYIRDN